MDKQARPLDDYFDAARGEPGISEHEVRAIVRRGPLARTAPAWRRLGAVLGVAGAVAIGYFMLAPDRAARDRQPGSGVVAVRSGGAPASIASAADTSTTRHPSSILNHGETMNGKNIVRGVATAALAMGMTAGAHAQKAEAPKREVRKEVRVRMEHTTSPAMGQLAAELGRSAADFWTARLNGYKQRIDRIVSPADLDALNRMRVRFGVMLAEHASVEAGVDHAAATNEEQKVIVHRIERHDGEDSTNEANTREKREIKIRIDGDGAGAMEFLELHQGAREIAGKYREDFDALGRDVMADFVTFLRQMSEAGNAFMANHRAEIEQSEDGKEMSVVINGAQDVIATLDSEEKQAMMRMVYSFAAEPLVMLYDGAELRDFFGQAGPLSSAVTGLNLPATTVLKQNAPNPAAAETTIAYELPEASSATTLRLYDATGAIVQTLDQGAREAGTHVATVDVSSLASGVYLYHLTVKTAAGERVYSKTMQVVK